jgi:hypothetical protein
MIIFLANLLRNAAFGEVADMRRHERPIPA